MSKTPADILAELIDEVADIIAESPNGIPSGHLYAMLMGRMTLEEYSFFVHAMVATGKIRVDNHLLHRVKK